MPSTLLWLNAWTSIPFKINSAAISACRSENVRTKSGFSDSILGMSALVKAPTRTFSLRTPGGLTAYHVAPTILACSPSKYNVSTVSSVKQTIRFGLKSFIFFCASISSLRRFSFSHNVNDLILLLVDKLFLYQSVRDMLLY